MHNFSHFIYDVIFILVSFLIQEFLKRNFFFTKFQVEEFFFLNFCQKCIALFHVNHKFGADLLPFIGFIENFPHGRYILIFRNYLNGVDNHTRQISSLLSILFICIYLLI